MLEVIKGSAISDGDQIDGLTAQSLNDHYANISIDNGYLAPRPKLTAFDGLTRITEMTVFRMLDTLHPTATGLDRTPAWFLRLGAPVFAAPLARLFDQSLATGVVPHHWKTAVISPIPKTATPTQLGERLQSRQSCRARSSASSSVPTSTRHYCSRVRHLTSVTSSRSDRRDQRRLQSWRCYTPSSQCWPRTTSCTSSPWDFSKAFDSVRHASLMTKFAHLEIPDCVYNWIRDFFDSHAHCTR